MKKQTFKLYSSTDAEVVEMVDTLHSGCSGREPMWVQVPSSVCLLVQNGK